MIISKLLLFGSVIIAKLEGLVLRDSTKIYVTPGVRFGDDKQDHHKAASPKEALDLGSNYLVIGRSITGNSNPNEKLEEIISSL